MRNTRAPVVVGVFVVAIATAFACTDISGSSTAVLSIQFDSLPVPAVAIGDTLRDTTGAVVYPVVRAFNFKGGEIVPAPAWFQSPDSGITVDSATGIIVGDSLRATSARVIATVGNLQALQNIGVTLRPDLVQAINAVDSLKYSILDSTKNISPELQVKLTHGVAPNDSAVKSWIVSFQIVYQSNPQLGDLRNTVDRPSMVDTTDANGIAGRQIRLHSVFLGSATAVDSIVVNATARYHGVPVSGSPVRLVLLLKPAS
ncbi:MAG TPA: hypothetical protein VLJ83_01805 [Gemmatimonadaceae bacterium]|nr:hypothetical protein [Gemmatimonadaceae bacterium]